MYYNSRSMSRRSFLGLAGLATVSFGLSLAGCSTGTASGTSGSGSAASLDKIVMAWLPNSSTSEFDAGREEFGKKLSEYAGVEVELMTTTDYNVVVEAIASGKAHLASMGAEGYIEAQKKNANVKALVVASDKNGSLDGAKYYSRMCVLEENMNEYKDSSSSTGYSIQNIKGKRMSFVSQSSTSGFKVPANAIMKAFPDDVKSTDELTAPGFFSEVLFGSSHPGSAVNLLQGDADVAAFCDTSTDLYMDVPAGERDAVNQPGSIYTVSEDASEPFNRVRGKKFGIIQSTPVLNGPIVYNGDVVPEDIVQKLIDGLTSEDCLNDELIFAPAGVKDNGALWSRDRSGGFLTVEDSWFDPIRELA